MPQSNVLNANLPHVACVLLWYPLFTQPFIFREVEGLRKILPMRVYTLYGENLRHCSSEMKRAAGHAKTYGLKALLPLLWSLCRQTGANPAFVWKLFKRSLWYKWPSAETFGENLWAFCAGLMLGRQFQMDGIDMVYAPWPRGAATAAWVGASLAGLPFAMAARGDNLNPADPDLGKKFSGAVFVRANNAADQKRIESFDKGQAAGKTILIYNSLTLPPAPRTGKRPRFSEKSMKLLAVGRFDVTKGFDVLLQACAILKKKGVDFQLTLAGGGGKVMGIGNLGQELRNLRTQLDLEDRVAMPGLISHDELPQILEDHDIFIAPCIVHSSGRRDGIPNTVIEALAYGMPVVSTNVNALPEVVRNGETGLAVPPNDPEALAEAIIKIAADPEKACELGANGAKLAREMFDGDANSRRLAEAFVNSHAAWRRAGKCAE